jgi:hypothetical protein
MSGIPEAGWLEDSAMNWTHSAALMPVLVCDIQQFTYWQLSLVYFFRIVPQLSFLNDG